MKRKKLMLLGGLRYLLPVIEAVHKQGYYVITVDYLPGNIAHKIANRVICLPMHHVLSEEEINRTLM